MIKIGNDNIESIYLYDHVLNALEDKLFQRILDLSLGKNIFIDFADSLTVIFFPNQKEVICEYENKKYTLNQLQVIKKLNFFINKILNMAVEKE